MYVNKINVLCPEKFAHSKGFSFAANFLGKCTKNLFPKTFLVKPVTVIQNRLKQKFKFFCISLVLIILSVQCCCRAVSAIAADRRFPRCSSSNVYLSLTLMDGRLHLQDGQMSWAFAWFLQVQHEQI